MPTLDEAKGAVRNNPRDPVAWTQLGELLAAAGDAARARDCFQRALSLAPDFPAARAGLAALSGPPAAATPPPPSVPAPAAPPPRREPPAPVPPRQESSAPPSAQAGAAASPASQQPIPPPLRAEPEQGEVRASVPLRSLRPSAPDVPLPVPPETLAPPPVAAPAELPILPFILPLLGFLLLGFAGYGMMSATGLMEMVPPGAITATVDPLSFPTATPQPTFPPTWTPEPPSPTPTVRPTYTPRPTRTPGPSPTPEGTPSDDTGSGGLSGSEGPTPTPEEIIENFYRTLIAVQVESLRVQAPLIALERGDGSRGESQDAAERYAESLSEARRWLDQAPAELAEVTEPLREAVITAEGEADDFARGRSGNGEDLLEASQELGNGLNVLIPTVEDVLLGPLEISEETLEEWRSEATE